MKTHSISTKFSSQEKLKLANKITLVGSLLNLILCLLKFAAGIFSGSQAMVADAVHSLSDLGTDFAVIVGLRLAARPKDSGHNYGHGKFETFATLLIALTLLAVGIGIGYTGFKSVLSVYHGAILEKPGIWAFVAAVISVISKEWLFRYTKINGQKLKSSAMIANAYHHRSDALSSIGTGLGVGAAILLGGEWAILDPIAAILVSVLIIKEALKIGYQSINDLLEAALPEALQEQILAIAQQTKGVITCHNLRTRRIGSNVAIDLHIWVDGSMTVTEGHEIAHQVEEAISEKMQLDIFYSIHVEPDEG